MCCVGALGSTAVVKRDGNWRTLEVRELVPGDVIELSGGDVVPADAVVSTSISFPRPPSKRSLIRLAVPTARAEALYAVPVLLSWDSTYSFST